MALTPEQIKNLKPGDIIDIRGFVNLPLCDGNILVELRYEFDHRTLPAYKSISTEFISLPPEKPKHDPCRPFREGDIVKYSPKDGRSMFRLEEGSTLKVKNDESDGIVEIWLWEEVGRYGSYPYSVFELVTPVEEIEPYSVHETEYLFRVMQVVEGGEQVVCEYRKSTHPNAKAAAEAERDRLNAEYRKTQTNE